MLYGMKKNWRPKKWTPESAMMVAIEKAKENPEGCKRLAAWAIERKSKITPNENKND